MLLDNALVLLFAIIKDGQPAHANKKHKPKDKEHDGGRLSMQKRGRRRPSIGIVNSAAFRKGDVNRQQDENVKCQHVDDISSKPCEHVEEAKHVGHAVTHADIEVFSRDGVPIAHLLHAFGDLVPPAALDQLAHVARASIDVNGNDEEDEAKHGCCNVQRGVELGRTANVIFEVRVAPRKAWVYVKEGQRVEVSGTVEKVALKNAYILKVCKILREKARKSEKRKRK